MKPTGFADAMGDIMDDNKGFIIIKKVENFKKLLGKSVTVFTTKNNPKDGISGTLKVELDGKKREIFSSENFKFQWKHVIWWEPNYKTKDGNQSTLIKLDLNRK